MGSPPGWPGEVLLIREIRRLREAWFLGIMVGAGTAPRVIGVGDQGDVVGGEFLVGARHHLPEVLGVDEENLAEALALTGGAVPSLGQEEQTG